MELNSIFDSELEALKSIYMDDLIVDFTSSTAKLKIIIHPYTAENLSEKYVYLTLEFSISSEYPNQVPSISIPNSRGLSDECCESIRENLKDLSYKHRGEEMLFKLIEYAKDCLSDNNHPSCVCSICLENFQQDFVRLDCYHFLHKFCFNKYLEINKEKICPVCRTPFHLDFFSDVTHSKDEDAPLTEFSFCKEYMDWQKKSVELFRRQELNGGIIDLEWEQNKYFISLNTSLPPEPKKNPETTRKNVCSEESVFNNVSKPQCSKSYNGSSELPFLKDFDKQKK
ncbi:E3 ubiquitin-protein ligase RNF25 isoform X1 [Hydra vulgaris]|uniref:E3 ubiquitin-protein ligase RNF25 n=1 Tax=Hydra vulgaris TaxID=6087 RepID=T2M846_HYDVU|nr:E3 ubiquitin-protein ligase RNF25 isoform X1 [Hydra vulgaris]